MAFRPAPARLRRAALWVPAACIGAATTPAIAAATDAAPYAGGMLQMLSGLLLVLAVLGVTIWLVRRFAPGPGAGAGTVKVVAGAAVGQRERVVLVEIGSTWLVLGVAPGQVRILHTMPKAALAPALTDALTRERTGFQSWLRRFMNAHGAN